VNDKLLEIDERLEAVEAWINEFIDEMNKDVGIVFTPVEDLLRDKDKDN